MNQTVQLLALARASLAEPRRDGALTILERTDGAPAVAFLVTLDRSAGAIILPLRTGRSVIARRCFERCAEPRVIESSQWEIECARIARVRDAHSTNLSTLVPKLGSARIPIPHANALNGDAWHGLDEGDSLQNSYATFLFAWIDPSR